MLNGQNGIEWDKMVLNGQNGIELNKMVLNGQIRIEWKKSYSMDKMVFNGQNCVELGREKKKGGGGGEKRMDVKQITSKREGERECVSQEYFYRPNRTDDNIDCNVCMHIVCKTIPIRITNEISFFERFWWGEGTGEGTCVYACQFQCACVCVCACVRAFM